MLLRNVNTSSEAELWIGRQVEFSGFFSRWQAGCAIVVQQHNRRLLADRPMRAFFVVVLAPLMRFRLSCRKHTSITEIPPITFRRPEMGPWFLVSLEPMETERQPRA
jgi:hypothetical protein